MPKQIWKIEQFHGGLNSNADPRDIADNELSELQNMAVDSIGKLIGMGFINYHQTTGVHPRANQIEPGYGVLQFSHDRIGGSVGSSEHLSDTQDFTDDDILMSDMLSSAQKTFLGDILDDDDDIFDFGGNNGDAGTTLIDSDGFTATNATFAVSSGVGQLSNNTTAFGLVTIPITTIANRTYQVEFDVTAVSGAEVNVSLGTSAAYNGSNKVSSSGAATGLTLGIPYYANDTSSFLALTLNTNTSGHWVKVDNLKVTLLSWDVTGGGGVNSNLTHTHATNATSTFVQLASNRAKVGINSCTYKFTYTVAHSSGDEDDISVFKIVGNDAEHLNNTGDFSSNWTRTDDMAVDSTDATYTHSAGVGTLIQTAANRIIEGVANVSYDFTYTISNFTETITLFEILGTGNQFAAATTALEQSNGTHTTTFTSHATDPDQPFTINITSGSSGTFNIDNVSLKISGAFANVDTDLTQTVGTHETTFLSSSTAVSNSFIIFITTTGTAVITIDDVSLKVHNAQETGDDYILFSEPDTAGTVDIFSERNNEWNSPITGMANNSGGLRKDSFYVVDGAVRISDGNFDNTNSTQWYGYVHRYFFGDNSTGFDVGMTNGVLISQWHQDDAAPEALAIKNFCGIYDDAADWPVEANPITVDIDSRALSYTDVYASGTIPAGADKIRTRVTWANGSHLDGIFRHGSLDPGYDSFCIIGDKILVRGASHADNEDETFTVVSVASTYIDFEESTDHSNSDDDIFLWNLSRSDWFDPVNTGWQCAVSTLYDDIKQESALSIDDTTLQPADIVSETASTVGGYGKLRVQFVAWADTSTGIQVNHKRVSGFKVYMRRQNTSLWYLQAEIDITKGIKWFGRGDYEMWAAAELDTDTGGKKDAYCNGEFLIAPREIETYESETGYDSSVSSLGFDGAGSGFKTAVVANRTAYAGNVKIKDWKGDMQAYGDVILKSGVNKFDSFSLDRKIEATVRDGDEIVKLEEYADRLLQFKKKKMELINISQEIEFLEGTFKYKGVLHPAATCKTDYGIAWVNRQGCYLYDGEKVIDLLEKKGLKVIHQDTWFQFTSDFATIGYLPKRRQLMILGDSRNQFTITGSIDPAASTTVPGSNTLFTKEIRVGDRLVVSGETKTVGSIESDTSLTVTSAFSNNSNDTAVECQRTGHIYLFDITTGSWARGFSVLSSVHIRTNFVVDWNQDQMWFSRSDTGNGWFWDSSAGGHNSTIVTTKDIDFGQPGVRKKVYKVYVTYQSGNATTNAQVDYDVNGGTTFPYDFANGTNFTSTELDAADGWQVAEFKPDTPSEANNIKSFRLRFTTDGSTPASFEINDISIVYRLKNIK